MEFLISAIKRHPIIAFILGVVYSIIAYYCFGFQIVETRSFDGLVIYIALRSIGTVFIIGSIFSIGTCVYIYFAKLVLKQEIE
ncbi:MAG: hypothetical protein RBR02_10950 [Desulfuromonadaceae bacterium]|nr:hypothetical protein [Desulfuromonadaceae bacterium]